MRHGSLLLTILFSACLAGTTAIAAPPDSIGLGDSFLVNGDKTQPVTVSRFGRDAYKVMGKGWEGVGLLTGTTYWGVFRQSWGTATDAPANARGTHRGIVQADGSVAIHGEYTSGLTGSFEVVWKPGTPASAAAAETLRAASDAKAPASSEASKVDVLPQPVTKVPPEYPSAARKAKIQGTVVIQTLVGEDGRVRDTRIMKSISGLDGAAVAAVRQWLFKPATAGGKPVAVWIVVPVKFVAS